ncbi:MAG: hypothetical protein J6S49_10205 [Erysipelotrichaceae bacterium]|nr:hypothetical protein [Erysipelotrichaceae bacterium]
MARLTRTQKYAELRENLATDKEASIESKDLSSYQNKLSNLTGENPYQSSNQQIYQRPNYNQPQRPMENDPRYTWTDFDETPLNNLADTYKYQNPNPIANNSVFNSIQEMPRTVVNPNDYDIAKLEEEDYIDDLIDSIRIDTTSPYDRKAPAGNDYRQQPQQPVYQQPVYQQQPQHQPQQPAYQQPQQPVHEEPVYQQPVYEQPKPVEPQRVETPVETKPIDVEPTPVINKQFEEISDFADYVNPTAPVEPIKTQEPVSISNDVPVNPQQSRTTFDMNERIRDMFDTDNVFGEVEETPVQTRPFENVDRREPDHSNDTARSYVSETIREVSDYNKMNGEQTITQLTNNMVNEVRHHDQEVKPQPQYNEPAVKPVENKEDEEFSNTVSMEIAKIIDDVSVEDHRNTQEVVRPVEQKPVEQPVVEPHPVLTKKLEETEEENVIEIKNLNELEAETVARDTVSNTIPFVVTNDDDEEIEDDEEGSNTILNIILIVLIIILVVVLGLIVFYILKTKGIF